MKRKYNKPVIIFENFSLTRNIDNVCENEFGFYAQDICAVEGTGGINTFTNGEHSECNYYPSDDLHDGLCYHVPVETNNLFNS